MSLGCTVRLLGLGEMGLIVHLVWFFSEGLFVWLWGFSILLRPGLEMVWEPKQFYSFPTPAFFWKTHHFPFDWTNHGFPIECGDVSGFAELTGVLGLVGVWFTNKLHFENPVRYQMGLKVLPVLQFEVNRGWVRFRGWKFPGGWNSLWGWRNWMWFYFQ